MKMYSMKAQSHSQETSWIWGTNLLTGTEHVLIQDRKNWITKKKNK